MPLITRKGSLFGQARRKAVPKERGEPEAKNKEDLPKEEEEGQGDEEIEIHEPQAWVERLTVCATRPLPLDTTTVDDDPIRERAFVSHAMESAREALRQLERNKIPWKRPSNFYAEMLKDDNHMNKVRQELERQENDVQKRAQRRQQKTQQKFSKELRAEAAKRDSARKREHHVAVEAAKKKAKRSRELAENGGDDEFDYGVYLDEDAPRSKKRPARSQNRKQLERRSSFRQGGVQKSKKAPKKRLGKASRKSQQGRRK